MSSLTAVFFTILVFGGWQVPGQTASVRVTHKALMPLCLDSAEIQHTRSWKLSPGEHTLTVTTHNRPRSGIASADPGIGRIHFTVVPQHKYEIELRAAAGADSTRVWTKGAWTPAVRDRTTDAVVSDAVEWIAGGCR